MPVELIFGVNDNNFVVLGKNNYNYNNNDSVIKLLKEYKKVQFDNNFNSNIDWLPNGITDISLGMAFNQPLENLPFTTKRIKIRNYNIGYVYFNQPIDNLPNSLEEFTIEHGIKFNQQLDNLPTNLKYLHITSLELMQSINNLPNSLEQICFLKFNYENTYKLPLNLQKISIYEYKCHIDDLNKLEYTGLRELQNNFPNIEFIYMK
jgi:hypothetical protein